MPPHTPYAAPQAEIEPADEHGSEPQHGKDLSPWFSIWLKPRATMQQMQWRWTTGGVLALAAMRGVADMLIRMANDIDPYSMPVALAIAIAGGGLGGVLGLYISGILLKWSGGWFGGHGSAADVRAAYAYSSIPVIWTLVLWVPAFLVFRGGYGLSEMGIDGGSPLLDYAFIALSILQVVVGVWAMVVFLKCLGVVHGFSAWRALGATLLIGMLIAVPIGLVAALIGAGS